jgi:hypothetical protein
MSESKVDSGNSPSQYLHVRLETNRRVIDYDMTTQTPTKVCKSFPHILNHTAIGCFLDGLSFRLFVRDSYTNVTLHQLNLLPFLTIVDNEKVHHRFVVQDEYYTIEPPFTDQQMMILDDLDNEENKPKFIVQRTPIREWIRTHFTRGRRCYWTNAGVENLKERDVFDKSDRDMVEEGYAPTNRVYGPEGYDPEFLAQL